MSKENYFLTYNSLISICILSEDYDNSQFAKFLYAEENLEHTLNFKTCKKSFLDYKDIKGSLFYIRNIEECNSNYSFSEKQDNISKEFGFLNKEKIHKNANFYLQHMTSKKFISIERTKDNKFRLKLMKNINKAANFYLRKVNEKRNSREYMNIKDVFNLSIYIEDDGLFYYVKDDINPIKDDIQHYNIIIEKEPTANFCVFNQQWFINETKEIYSGQLINIIFSVVKADKKEEYMLGVIKKEKKNEEIREDENENERKSENDDEDIKEEEKKPKYDEYEIIGIRYSKDEDLDKHVLYNTFWIMEEDTSCLEENNKVPMKIKEQIRIKNFNTGLYLNIKVKGDFELNNNLFDEEYSDILYEFYLVDERFLNDNYKFEYNFMFLNCTFGILSSEIMDEGEYILKGVFHKLKLNDLYDYKYYYKPLSLKMNNKIEKTTKKDKKNKKEKDDKKDFDEKTKNNKINKKIKDNKEDKDDKEDMYRLLIKQEDDFIFKIKKIDLQKGIQVTYVKKIIELQMNFQITYIKKMINSLDKVVSDDSKEDNGIIYKSIKFFLEYLLNIDYSFRDEKYESNIPVKERQNILFNFNIVELINKSLEYYLNKIEKEKDNFLNDQTRKTLNEILINIIKFFKNLSLENEEIKIAIYIISLNKLLKLSDIIFHNNITDITTLINFIFDLMNDSEALQDYFLGGGEILKKSSKKEYLKNYDLNGLLREDKLLEYIEKNHNYLLYYEKLIGLNKVQYKRKEIESRVKMHIEDVKKKTDKNKKTYNQIIDKIISEIIKLIKKHALLLDQFNNDMKDNEKKVNKRKTFRIDLKKNSVQLRRDEERHKKEIEEKGRKDRTRRATTKASSNIILDEIDREDTTNKFLEDEEKEINYDSNNKFFLFNETKKNEDDEPNKNNKKNNIDRKDNNVNLKKTFTLGLNFLKKKNAEPENKTNNKFGNLSFFNRVKSEFEKVEENKENKKNFNKIIFSSLTKRKSKFINKSRTKGTMERIESIRPNLILSYKDYLIKLGKIYQFIQFFTSLDLNKSLFINEYFMDLLNKESGKGGNLDPSLFIFFNGEKIDEQNNCFLDKNIVNFYLFHLYNKFFPNVKSNLSEKINLETITGADIINEIEDGNIKKEDYSDYDDESKYQKEMIQEFNLIDDDLCILYSIYQFLINQYTKTIFKLFNLKCNFYLNFQTINGITKSKNYFSDIIKNLLSKIVFLNKEYFQNLYQAFQKNPSLLNQEFDLDNQILQNNKNQRRLSIKDMMKNKVDKFSRREAMLIEYIYFFLKKCDEIKYLYEKMVIYKYIKNLVDYEKLKSEEENEIEENNEKLEDNYEKNISIKEKILSLSNYLNNQKLKILKSYEKLLKSNKKYSTTNGEKDERRNEENRNVEEGEKDKFTVLKMKEKSDFITQLLKKYEIKKFFNNIIYMESKSDNIFSDKSLKKLRRIMIYFQEIDNEILKLKINSDRNKVKKFEKEESLKIINRNLGKICIEQGKIFHLSSNGNRKGNILIQMLTYENKSFYKKIRFNKIFGRMVDNLNSFKRYKDKNILIYCSFLLKIFIDMKNIDNSFHKNFVKYFEFYIDFIMRSLKSINGFSKVIISDEEPLFLNVSYLGIEAFLLVLKNCKLDYKDFKENKKIDVFKVMIEIFSELQKIFDLFQNRKYKIIYQILYTYAVSRILLFLNSKRDYDLKSYYFLFSSIYPIQKMKANISFCFETINNSLDKEHILSRRNSSIFIEKSSLIEDTEESFSKYIQDEEKEGLIMSDSKERFTPMDLFVVKKENEKHYDDYKIKKEEEIEKKEEAEEEEEKEELEEEEEKEENKKINNNYNIDYIRWDDENEINKLSFYLNYLSVYVVYLNDKNSLIKEDKNEFPKKEIKEESNFSFTPLSDKIKSLLDTGHNYEVTKSKENSNNNISQIEKSILMEEKIFFGEDIGPKNIDYKFFSVLLESILVYRANLNGENIEIQIKKSNNKRKEEEKHMDEETDALKNNEELYINKNDIKRMFNKLLFRRL